MRRASGLRAALGSILVLIAGTGAAVAGEPPDYIVPSTLPGMTGLINTPTADILPSGTIRFGASFINKDQAYHARGRTDNNHYFFSVGFLPRIEVSFRASYFPDDKLSIYLEGEGTVDRGGSGRLLVLEEGDRTPAFAIGVDDIRGTRRFHSLYAVATKGFALESARLMARLSAGYGSTALDAKNHILEGGFGGAEVVYRDTASLVLDFDTEKWNTGIRLVMFQRLAAHASLLDFEALAGGFSWTQSF